MRTSWKTVLGLSMVGIWLAVSAPAQAASGVGPYYAVPSWDQTLPAATRFIVLTNMGSQAVLDRETGLVFEQSPDTTRRTWQDAQNHCAKKTVGNRKGWRLPTVQELASLVDPTVAAPGPVLSPGHPFVSVQSDSYWSATSSSVPGLSDTIAWAVSFATGGVGDGLVKTANDLFVWCVRGGQGVDFQ